MLPGAHLAFKKDKTAYYRSSITFCNKHISLGSFSSEQEAHQAYLEASHLLSDFSTTIDDVFSLPTILSFNKVISLLNFRDNHIYFKNPIYLRNNYFVYYLSPFEEFKFDIDDLFYYSSHKIMRRQGHLLSMTMVCRLAFSPAMASKIMQSPDVITILPMKTLLIYAILILL